MESNKKNAIRNIFVALAFLSATFYSFFWEFNFLVSSVAILFSIGFFSFVALLLSPDVVLPKVFWILMALLLINVFGLAITPAEFDASSRWILSLIVVLLLATLLSKSDSFAKAGLVIILVFACFFVAGVYLQYFDPSLIDKINSVTLKDGAYASFIELGSFGFYSGFSGFNAVSGFFSGVAAIIFLSYYISRKGLKKIIFLILSLVAFAAAIISQKRSIAIAVPITFFILLLIKRLSDRSVRSFFGFLVLVAALALAGYLIVTQTESGQLMLKRFESSEDVSSGRFGIYGNLLKDWERYFIFGNGPASVRPLIGDEAHNIYLQLFYENGIIGVLIAVVLFIYNLIITLQALLYNYHVGKVFDQLLIASLGIQILFLIYGFFGNCITDTHFFLIYIIFSSIVYPKFLKSRSRRRKAYIENNYVLNNYR